MANVLTTVFGSSNDRLVKRLGRIVRQIGDLEGEYQGLSAEAFPELTTRFRARLADGETLDDLLPEAFAAVREVARRTIGLRHYDVQMVGGIVLHQGKIAEMKTGEGKTLVATLALYLNALTGKGAHLVTVNDYLARRDVQWMGPIYHYLGLSIGSIIHDTSLLFDPHYMPKDYRFLHLRPVERRDAYAADITYGTNNEFGFDYLRDNMKFTLDEYAQRDLNFAIVDEVDNILIDEARTPLIISGPAEQSSEKYYTVNRIIPRLIRETDYTIDEKHRNAMLTEAGVAKCERLLGVTNLYDPSQIDTLHHVTQALRAHVLFKRDVDYVVKDGEVIIVDEFTGRLMSGRRWSDGLHQAVEAKEGVRIESENVTLATITIQNYFRMYEKLAGMTGTADTESVEFQNTYKLEVVVVPSNKPLARTDYPDVVYRTEREKFDAVVEEIRDSHERGQPVLVGTTSVEKSERVSKLLKKGGVRHNVLNATNHEAEANIIAQAGRIGAVTIATNMAGRGTDILLGGNPDYLARSDMENEWLKGLGAEVGRAAGTERFEDALRALHEDYSETRQALVERYQPELERLDGVRASALKTLSEVEEELHALSPYAGVFERYEEAKHLHLDAAMRAGQPVPEVFTKARQTLVDTLAPVVAGSPAGEQLTRVGSELDALFEAWQRTRGEEPPGRTGPPPPSFRAALAEVLLRDAPVARRRELAAQVKIDVPKLVETDGRWLEAFAAGKAPAGSGTPGVLDALLGRVVPGVAAAALTQAAIDATASARDLLPEGIDAWRFEYERALRAAELHALVNQAEDDEARREVAARYVEAERTHAAAEEAFEAWRSPYEQALRQAERTYDEQRALYTRKVEEIREELQKAPELYEERSKELLAHYETRCAEEREKVLEAGGLHILGTERHEARRIDNQLRGRAGRQGDPGSSRFYLSLEDDLMRIFVGDRMQSLMERLGMEEGVPIEHRLVTRSIRNAQEKVEAHNFDMRKHLLEYDDVLNKQREVIYARRRELLSDDDDLKAEVIEIAERLAVDLVGAFATKDDPAEEWEWDTFEDAVFQQFNLRLGLDDAARAAATPEGVEEQLVTAVRTAYEARETSFGPPVMRHLERLLWLQTLDGLWRDHLVSMEHLKEGIGLRGYGQRDPLQEYQKEAFELFESLVQRMEADVVEKLMSVQVQTEPARGAVRRPMAVGAGGEAPMPDAIADLERRRARQGARLRLSKGPEAGEDAPRQTTVRNEGPKVGRNAPCPCGSGKKYKKCHGAG
jgi:preprotein translocase SecA subunit